MLMMLMFYVVLYVQVCYVCFCTRASIDASIDVIQIRWLYDLTDPRRRNIYFSMSKRHILRHNHCFGIGFASIEFITAKIRRL